MVSRDPDADSEDPSAAELEVVDELRTPWALYGALLVLAASGLIALSLFLRPESSTVDEAAERSSAPTARAESESSSPAARGNNPPRAEIRIRRESVFPARYQVSSLFSTDPDEGETDQLASAWDFGGGSGNAEARLGTVTFPGGGTYTIALTVTDPHGASDRTELLVEVPVLEPEPFSDWADAQPGLRVRVVDERIGSLNDLAEALTEGQTVVTDTSTTEIGLAITDLTEHFGLAFDGALLIETPGSYGLRLSSDDGSRLHILGHLLIDLGGTHGEESSSARLTLERGAYPLALHYFQGGGNRALSLEWRPPGEDWQPIPASALRHR